MVTWYKFEFAVWRKGDALTSLISYAKPYAKLGKKMTASKHPVITNNKIPLELKVILFK